MVVLAAAVTTKNGKALLSRQFVELTRARIEGLLAAFPKLMGTEKQHTFIETESIRYVYQPLESLYVLLLTNKSSNILEDLESLHLLAKIVPEYCHVLEEKEIVKHAFDIIFAFDEAIAMGYKERVNIQQIKHFTTMESNDEMRFKSEQKTKMLQAKKEADRQRKAIEKKRTEDRKFGISSDDMSRSITNSSVSSPSRSTFSAEPVVESKREPSRSSNESSGRLGGKGLQLGKSKKTGGYSQILKEEDVPDNVDASSSTAKGGPIESASSFSEKVHVEISEKITLVAENDGGLKNMEVKGELIVSVSDPQFSRIAVAINQTDNKEFQFKSHPNMNKTLYTNSNVLALKDTNKSYPVGTPSSILKWRYATKDEDAIPLTINVWPSASGSKTTVPVEYEKKCDFDLHDVVIAIPIPGVAPVIGEVVGSCDFDHKKGLLFWRIPLIDESNSSGSMEFTVATNSNAFFPVQVFFKSSSTYSGIKILGVTADDGSNQPVTYSQETSLGVEQYDIE